MTARFSRVRMAAVLTGLFVLVGVSFALAMSFGEEPLSWKEVLRPGSTEALIFWSLRWPRAVLALLVGASLAASGCALQGLLRNPLADPFVLGVSGGAALGATVAMVWGAHVPAWMELPVTTVLALLGALGATVFVLWLGSLSGSSVFATLLSGVIFNAFALAVITFLKVLFSPDKTSELLFFLAGSLGYESRATLLVAGGLQAVALGALWAQSGRLNLLTLGDDDAASLGVPVEKTRRMLWLTVSLSVAVSVSLAGLLGFVGLVVPHILRLWLGPDQRLLLPASALGGAAFLLLSDAAARMMFPWFGAQVPVGVLTSILGGGFFLGLLFRARTSRL